MAVAGAVGGADAGARDGAPQQDGVDPVGAEGAALVEGQDDEGAAGVEPGVRQQRGEPVAGPLACDRDGRVVAVVGWWAWGVRMCVGGCVKLRPRLTHVRGNEHPLGERVGGKVPLEHGEVLALGQSVRVGRDRVEAHQGAADRCQFAGVCPR